MAKSSKPRKSLTEDDVRKARAESREVRLYDAKVAALFLRVLPSGIKTWCVTWGRNRVKAIGKWPGVTVEAARVQASALLVETAKHGAPVAVIEAKKPNKGKPITLHDYVDGDYRLWARHELKRGDEAANRILAVFEKLADKPLSGITQKAVEAIITARRREGRTTATTNRDLAGIKAALAKAVEWGLIEVHPLLAVKPSRVTTGNVVRYLSGPEEKRLRKALDKREAERRASRERHNAWHDERGTTGHAQWPADAYTDHLMPLVMLAMNTGLRRGELFGLTWDDVNLPGKMLTVRAETAKSRKARHVPLNAEAMEVLKRVKKHSDGAGLVFANDKGDRFGSIKKSWAGLLESAGVDDFRFHDLRHDFASKLVMAGVDLYTVKELLGHASIEMTQRYAHLAPHKLADAVALIGNKNPATSR